MKCNEYLDEFKIQAVRRIYAGESQKELCEELNISKSTLWGWKCKYRGLIEKELDVQNKPQEIRGFIEIVQPMKETKKKPLFRYQQADIVEIDYRDYKIYCSVNQLPRVLDLI